jgi:hypothetical protein
VRTCTEIARDAERHGDCRDGQGARPGDPSP